MIETVASLPSTSDELAARLARGEMLGEGCWLVADRQTAGRGRQSRAWFDGSGNFMGSTVIRPAFGDPPLPSLALVAGLAVLEAVQPHLPPPAHALLKWPNDLLVGGAKLAGILLEQCSGAVIVGIGVNLAAAPELPDRKTVALSAFTPAPDRDLFAADLARAMATEIERWRTYGLGPVISRWQTTAHPQGTPLAVGEPGEEPLIGTFAGLDGNGALLLTLPDGTTRTIHAGEVRLAGQD